MRHTIIATASVGLLAGHALASPVITEPVSYNNFSFRSQVIDGEIVQTNQFQRAGTERTIGGVFSGGGASDGYTRTAFLFEYLTYWDANATPPLVPLDEIDVHLEATAVTGVAAGEKVLTAFSSSVTTFKLTETGIFDFSAVFDIDQLTEGGEVQSQALIRIYPENPYNPVYELLVANEGIPDSVIWSSVLEPGNYTMELSLSTFAAATGEGFHASSAAILDAHANFVAIPAPGGIGLIGLAWLFPSRRRR